ncbi:MAG: hypothetical protein IJ132_06050 [Firmicutes bacterium]|nr:hypothetical protein [Bacillota bacterium]
MKKKSIILLALILTMLVVMTACGSDEDKNSEEKKEPTELSGPVRVVAQNDATGVSVFKEMGDNYIVKTHKKIGDVRDAIKDGKYDAAILSAGIAAEMYDKTDGKLVEISPVSLNGIYAVANGYNKDDFQLSWLPNKNVVIMGKNSTADQVLQQLMEDTGRSFSSIKTKYINSYSGVKKAFAQWGAIVICSEPYASRLEKLTDVIKVYDLSEDYRISYKTDVPAEVLVVSKKMYDERPDDIKIMIKEYEETLPKISNENRKTYAKFVFYGQSNRGEMILRQYNETMDNKMKYYSTDKQ